MFYSSKNNSSLFYFIQKVNKIRTLHSPSEHENTNPLRVFGNPEINFNQYLANSNRSAKELEIISNFQNYLTDIVDNTFPDTIVHPFGSALSGVDEPYSDVDFTIINLQNLYHQVVGCKMPFQKRNIVSILSKLIPKIKKRYQKLQFIQFAKTPLVRVNLEEYPIHFDITIEGFNPIVNSYFIKCCCLHDPFIKDLIKIVKVWAKSNNIYGANINFLSGYTWTILLLYYLTEIRSPSLLPKIIGQYPFTEKNTIKDILNFLNQVNNSSSHNLSHEEVFDGFLTFVMRMLEEKQPIFFSTSSTLPSRMYQTYVYVSDPFITKNIGISLTEENGYKTMMIALKTQEQLRTAFSIK